MMREKRSRLNEQERTVSLHWVAAETEEQSREEGDTYIVSSSSLVYNRTRLSRGYLKHGTFESKEATCAPKEPEGNRRGS